MTDAMVITADSEEHRVDLDRMENYRGFLALVGERLGWRYRDAQNAAPGWGHFSSGGG